MKYTKERFEVMSDFEVSKALCVLLGFDVSGVTESRNQMIDAVPSIRNDWSRLMPLAVKHKIALVPLIESRSWTATNHVYSYMTDSSFRFKEDGGISYNHQSPQRAIACCLILVLQEQ
jgi:hypothetical protein